MMAKTELGGFRIAAGSKAFSVAANIPKLTVNIPEGRDITYPMAKELAKHIKSRWRVGETPEGERKQLSARTIEWRTGVRAAAYVERVFKAASEGKKVRKQRAASEVAFVSTGAMIRGTRALHRGDDSIVKVPDEREAAVEQIETASTPSGKRWGPTSVISIVDEPLNAVFKQIMDRVLS